MLRLRKILLSNYTYIFFLIIFIPIIILRLSINYKSIYNINTHRVEGIIYKIEDNKIYLKSKENLLCYLKDNNNYKLGDKVILIGEFKKVEKQKTKNLFDYQKYLSYKHIYYEVFVEDIKLISNNKNIYYKIKQLIIDLLDNNPYLHTFIIGDKTKISKEVLTSYQENGISHLFAISGMHITLLSGLILKLLKKIEENKRYLITSIFLIIYLLICNPSASIIRGVLFFILFSINKIYYFYIKPTNIFIVVVIITLMINPYYIYDVGFLYSFSISLSLLILSNKLSSSNYFISLLKVSIISFIVSLPISLYNFNEINILGIIYNLFYVPFISIIIFPLSLIVLIYKPLLPLYNLLTSILENTSLLLNKIKIFTFIFPRLPILFYLIYIIIIILVFTNNKYIILLILLLTIHYLSPLVLNNEIIEVLDIGQGDSILIRSNNKTCLIDTGGVANSTYHISNQVTLPLLKAYGIKRIDKMYLTHGDYDHLGEAINIIKNIKVDSIYINSNRINYNEKQLFKYSNNIKKLKEGTITTCGKMTLYELNKSFNDENDSSLVLLGIYNNKTYLFAGDASIKTEEYILNNYDLPHIDVLKVGHHGSKTSTSNNLLDVTRPSLAIISVGKDNKFNHPNKEVIDKLRYYKIPYQRTDRVGTITINLKNAQIIEK